MTSSSEQYLRDFHQRLTSTTSRAFGALQARAGEVAYASSYHVLTERVPDRGAALTVLDLACGDGHLLEILARRRQPELRLIGVDMSEGELDVARAKLGVDVVLLRERAQQLSLASASVDYVLSHMALMLMSDIEQVLREIRRVLREGGCLAAVVGRRFLLGEIGEAFFQVFRPIARAELPPLRYGDPRVSSEAGWLELLGDGFGGVRCEDIEIPMSVTPEVLWDALTETYDIDRMSPAVRERLRCELLAAWAPLRRADGLLETGWGVRLVEARAA
jgi:SAM-dependent methyltransferase